MFFDIADFSDTNSSINRLVHFIGRYFDDNPLIDSLPTSEAIFKLTWRISPKPGNKSLLSPAAINILSVIRLLLLAITPKPIPGKV